MVSGRAFSQPAAGDEVLARLGLIELREHLAGLVFVAGIAAEREQRVRRERDEVVERQAARDVLDVRVQPAVLVDDEDRRQLAGGLGRPHEVAAHLAVALRRVVLDVLHLDARVVGLDDLRLGELRAELIEQHRGGHAADGVLGGLVEEAAAVERAVDVGVEQNRAVPDRNRERSCVPSSISWKSGRALSRQSHRPSGSCIRNHKPPTTASFLDPPLLRMAANLSAAMRARRPASKSK